MLGSSEAMSANHHRADISVIICTQNRASSLKITLELLAAADRDGIRSEVIVVDNAGHDNTKEVVDSFQHLIPLRYLYEPTLGVFGKCHALNRALDAGGLGEIIAVLDDDMSPHPGWFKGVTAICNRWPDKDIFTGSTPIVWPYDEVPDWAKKPGSLGGIFSSLTVGGSDSPLEDWGWFLGGHFWFRSRALAQGLRFKDVWLTEPDFQLDLVEQGFTGVAGPDASAGHRIQPALLQQSVALDRARQAGNCKAWVRLRPYRRSVRQARLFRAHPLLSRAFCLLNHLRWRFVYLASTLYPSADRRFECKLIALERMTTAIEYLRAASGLEQYSPWKRVRAEQSQ
jgi:glycosyltransferase involved in cell wall biosynthesis